MKETLKLTHLVALFLICSQSFAQNPPITNGLVGYWPFSGNANDYSGNSRNGVINSAVLTTDKNNNSNSAFYFNGNSYIQVDNMPALVNGFTFSLWFNADASQTTEIPTLLAYQNTNIGLLLEQYSNKMNLYNYESWKWNCLNTIGLNPGVWQHLVITWNAVSGELKYYLDRTLVASYSNNNQNLTSILQGSIFRIGTRGHQSKNEPLLYFFTGKIDEVMVFNRALQIDEVQQVYQSAFKSSWLNNQENVYFNTGNVGIGTSTPDQKLTVKGKIHTEEVLIDLNVPAPDFVFEKDYPLIDIEKIESYINEHKHLPEIPSAGELEKNGIQLGEMNMKLLQKIEELTLYIIEMDKEIKSLKDKNEILEKKVNELEVTK